MTHHLLRPRHASRLAAVTLALALSAAVAGCSSDADTDAASGDPTTTASTAPSATAPSSTAAAGETPTSDDAEDATAPATLVAERSGGRVSCVAKTTSNELVTLYDSIAQATGDLTITRVRAGGDGLRVVGAEGVLVTANPAFGPGISIGDRWPIPADRMLRQKTDITSRAELKGMALSEDDRVLPLVALRADPGAVLDELLLTYRDAAGRSAEVSLPVHTRFAAGRCPGI